MAKSLWSSKDPQGWSDVLNQLEDAYKGDEKLQELNRWYEQELPAAIATRAPNRHITHQELVKLVDWKLTRGKWRPRLLDFAKAATEAQVHEASSNAFLLLPAVEHSMAEGKQQQQQGAAGKLSPIGSKRSAAPSGPSAAKRRKANPAAAPDSNVSLPARQGGANTSAAGAKAATEVAAASTVTARSDLRTVKAALEALTVLKGVGPATASGLLAAADSSCPFMSDEALEAAIGVRDYTVKVYLQLVEALRAKAKWLQRQQPGLGWNAVLVERSLYAAQCLAKPQRNLGKAAPRKAKGMPEHKENEQ